MLVNLSFMQSCVVYSESKQTMINGRKKLLPVAMISVIMLQLPQLVAVQIDLFWQVMDEASETDFVITGKIDVIPL